MKQRFWKIIVAKDGEHIAEIECAGRIYSGVQTAITVLPDEMSFQGVKAEIGLKSGAGVSITTDCFEPPEEVAVPGEVIDSTNPHVWGLHDVLAARREGWEMMTLGLQYVGFAKYKESNQAPAHLLTHIWNQAMQGSKLHQKALLVCLKDGAKCAS